MCLNEEKYTGKKKAIPKKRRGFETRAESAREHQQSKALGSLQEERKQRAERI